jgi:TRAPP trafficking subunit Trs65
MDLAPAVMDENIIHALQKSSINSTTDTDLVPISADVRVGPLCVGSCHEVQIKMLGLRVGVWRLEAVRVVDLAREMEITRDRERDREGSGAGAGSGVVDIAGNCLPEVVVVEGDEPMGRGMEGSRGVGLE